MSDNFEDFLCDLHLQKTAAINELRFEDAREINDDIQREIEKRALDLIQQAEAIALREVARSQQHYRDRCEDIAEEKRKLDSRLYSRFQVLFEETQDEHIQQLMDLEKERGLTLLEESERDIPEQIELLERAKQVAMLSRFEEAIELRAQARVVGEQELESRRVQVEEHFAQAKEEMLKQHQEELDQIGVLHQQEIEALMKEHQEVEKLAKVKFAEEIATITNTALVKFEATKASARVKEEASKRLRAEIAEMMKEFGELPPVKVKLTKAEQMRLTTLCPTKSAGVGVIREITEGVIERGIRTAKAPTARTGLRPPSKSSTGLISRAYSAKIGRR